MTDRERAAHQLAEAERRPWRAEYDAETGEHRIYDKAGLVLCVGSYAMDVTRQSALASAIVETSGEIERLAALKEGE